MSKKRDLDREGLEVYLINLLLAFRPYLQIGGFLLLIYALVGLEAQPKSRYFAA
ncbi:MAG: hypothetical protein JEZ06_18100 [Anaerolineaceae bacterium]|nr:hypothetical protein [Anaerolineaceae bacterium]